MDPVSFVLVAAGAIASGAATKAGEDTWDRFKSAFARRFHKTPEAVTTLESLREAHATGDKEAADQHSQVLHELLAEARLTNQDPLVLDAQRILQSAGSPHVSLYSINTANSSAIGTNAQVINYPQTSETP